MKFYESWMFCRKIFFFHKWIEMSALHHLIVYKYIHGNMDVICNFLQTSNKNKTGMIRINNRKMDIHLLEKLEATTESDHLIQSY